jgi:tetratricopeptide (TPR) repeat protein
MKRYAPLILALFLVLASVPARALPRQEPWIELQTANFTLFSNAGESQARRVGADLERLRDALTKLSPGLTLNSPAPTYIFVFRNTASLQPYLRTYNGQPLSSAGYFLSHPLANYVAINGDRRGDEKGIVYHEYLHYVLRNNYADLPLWLHEGLAEYYSTFEVGRDEARIGLPIAAHVEWLRTHSLIPLSNLLAVDERSQEYNESSRRGVFYAESWALVHYLVSGNPERRRQAAEFLQLAQAGASPAKLFSQAFGADPAVLERELRTYVRSYAFSSTRVPIRPEANLAMEARPMTWADTLYRLGDLLANLGEEHRAAAAEHFRAALAAKPDHGPALSGLGFLEELANHPQEARAWYQKAARLAPDDFLVQYRYATSLLEEDSDPDALRQARVALSRAVRLRPDFGEAWAQLGYTYQSEDVLPAEAVQALETAHRLLPSRLEVAYNLALAYAPGREGARPAGRGRHGRKRPRGPPERGLPPGRGPPGGRQAGGGDPHPGAGPGEDRPRVAARRADQADRRGPQRPELQPFRRRVQPGGASGQPGRRPGRGRHPRAPGADDPGSHAGRAGPPAARKA